MSQIAENNTPHYRDCQNRLENTPYFQEIVEIINSENFSKNKLLNTIKKLVGHEKGKLLVSVLPYLKIENPTYRELAQIARVSQETARKYVEDHAPDIFLQKARVGDVA